MSPLQVQPPPAAAPPLPHPHALGAPDVARHLGVDPAQGLSGEDAAARQALHGPNRLPEAAGPGCLQRLLAPLRDVMTLLLLVAAAVSAVVGDLADTVVIGLIVALNAALSAWQAWQADRALAALATLAEPAATVRRDGQVQAVASAHLVPGDVVLLDAGQRVPADLRLHQVAQLQVDESTLTGESLTVAKHPRALPPGEHALHERHNMAWKGTLVTHGRAEGLVVSTGAGTQLGQIARLLEGGMPPRSTPLQRRLAEVGRRLALVALAICALVFGLGLLRGEAPGLMALTAISLAVAAIPESLPAVVTVLLALGARRMVQARALARRLSAVETLGAVTVICSDKTGTLTANRMALHAAWPAPAPAALWEAAALCNDAQPGPGGWLGDPTETALVAAAERQGLDVPALRAQLPRVAEWPFDAERKRMSTRHADRLVLKGAPEAVLPRCTGWAEALDDGRPWSAEAVLAEAQRLASEGARVLALAERRGPAWAPAPAAGTPADEVERGLRLLGLVGLVDPPRPESAAAVAHAHAAGIRTVMITGDHPVTAQAIARQLALADDAALRPVTGAELARLDEAGLAATVARSSVYARTDPAQKIRIVQALQAQGEVVAMTGDGVNDAPALQGADIGVAMGLRGTDVAREAAGLVLLDDRFDTIVTAVREGRRIHDNIRKFVRYALTGNSGEVAVLLLAPLLGLPLPLLPLQILWINLVTDGLPGLALAAEPTEPQAMRRPPRPPAESLFARGLGLHVLSVGLLIAALCLGAQAWALHAPQALGHAHWQTMVFTMLTLSQMAHVLAIRSEHESLFTQGLRSNPALAAAVALTLALQAAVVYLPALQRWFHTEALSAPEAAVCLAAAGVVFLAVEAEKAWRRHAPRPTDAPGPLRKRKRPWGAGG